MISFFLGFIKNQLNAEMKVGFVNIISIFRRTVAGTPQITDNVSGLDDGSFFQTGLIGVIFAQMGIVLIPFFVKAADTKPPASVLVPANGFYNSGFDGNNRGSGLA